MLRWVRSLLLNTQAEWDGHLLLFAPVGHITNGVRYDRYEGVKRRILRYQGYVEEERGGIFIWRFRGVMLSIQLRGFGLAALHYSIL